MFLTVPRPVSLSIFQYRLSTSRVKKQVLSDRFSQQMTSSKW